MDIKDLYAPIQRQEEGAWMDVVRPDKTSTDIRILIAGPDSERQRKGRYKTLAAYDAKLRIRDGHLKAEDNDAMAIDMIARCIIDWTGIEDGDQPFECTHENAAILLTKLPWLREKIDTFAASRAPYIGQDQPAPAAQDEAA